MPQITLLSQETIDKIAAGEVVERPSSVVKELVENAIDARATAVTVEIKEGGTTFVRITDNGCGIEREQVPLAFLRHSTSKIKSVEDLLCIHSLGFRGEALSSIAAVSQVELITKTYSDLTGTRYVIEGSREMSNDEIGAPDGTTFIVRNLFYNTPARKKFLKTAQTEGNYISDLSDFKVITEYIEQKANPDDKLFLFNVTMQNHGGYTIPYANFDQEVWLTGDMEGKYPEADMYLSLVKKSDEAFEWLVNYFSQCDQPTMIVMFGDHQPGIEDEFFDEAMGVESAKVPNEQKMVWYETPFVIWTNYDQPSEDMGRLGAIYLSSYVLKRANLSLTPYNEFLLQLSEKLPIIHHLGIWESDGTDHSWEDAESGDYDWKEQLVEYENLVYNHSLDSKTVNEMFSIAQ